MNATPHTPYHEWSRYQWASVDPLPDEPEVPQWNLSQWPGDQGSGHATARPDPAVMATDQAGYSGFAHNPGGGSRWALGYTH